MTGTHWPDVSDYSQLKSIGYGFGVTNVAPGDVAGAKQKLDAAHNAGIKLIIGLYAFGGPEPYVLNANGTWTISRGSIDVLNYLESRESDIVAFFGFNEPYWVEPGRRHRAPAASSPPRSCRQLRTKIQAVWPEPRSTTTSAGRASGRRGGLLQRIFVLGNKYADQTGVADYVGVWDYPFETTGYMRRGDWLVCKETNFVINSMHAVPVWLNQAHGILGSLVFPTQAPLPAWYSAVRSALPAGSLISWYVWRQGIHGDISRIIPRTGR